MPQLYKAQAAGAAFARGAPTQNPATQQAQAPRNTATRPLQGNASCGPILRAENAKGVPQPKGAGAITPIPLAGGYTPAPPDVQALFAARREGVALTAQDMPSDVVAHVQACWQRVQVAMQPVSQPVVAAWLKKLGQLVSNPPGAADAAAQCRAIYEVCADIPAGAWCPQARLAWARQPARNGYPVGARWPAPAELRAVLLPFANTIWRDAHGCKALLGRPTRTP
ncbi:MULTISPECIES: hypothetical protein [Acetobacter]|uniref:Uncharacterized protein n=1 Tax=Acetobacter pomorum DM001 TaxID=945681 RepID=F1YVK9_9PROT|nr:MULTISPECIES: hypothetical protein [Acetobacter]ATI11834.1 hypothetical protein CPF11_04790 [Acetobacter pomorum]EGE47314.1 Hypothetical protein APO_1999 [Acetobacter pomorum DM001]KGB21896.1 hypothetical protein ApDm4_2803 [Acetobacter pomorum]